MDKTIYVLSLDTGAMTLMLASVVEEIKWDVESESFRFYHENDGGTEFIECKDYILLNSSESILEHGYE